MVLKHLPPLSGGNIPQDNTLIQPAREEKKPIGRKLDRKHTSAVVQQRALKLPSNSPKPNRAIIASSSQNRPRRIPRQGGDVLPLPVLMCGVIQNKM
jgi:hypothetical protein